MDADRLQIIHEEFGCTACKHFRGIVCDAFPAGIPSEILMGVVSHTTPIPGDHGIQFDLNIEFIRERVPSFLEEPPALDDPAG